MEQNWGGSEPGRLARLWLLQHSMRYAFFGDGSRWPGLEPDRLYGCDAAAAASSDGGRSVPRLAWVDRARGLGITLVVAGHVLGGIVAAALVSDRGVAVRTIDVIYSFHMPLFFFVSGLLAETRSRSPAAGAFVVGKLRTLAWPYLLWSVVQVALHWLASPVANHRVDTSALLRLAWEPVEQFWFLYVLFVLSVGWSLLRRTGATAPALLGAAALIYFVPGHVGLGSWGVLYMVASNAVWFAAGAAIGAVRLWRVLDEWPLPLVTSAMLFALLRSLALQGFGSPSATGELALDMLRCGIAAMGIVASLLFATALERAVQRVRALRSAAGKVPGRSRIRRATSVIVHAPAHLVALLAVAALHLGEASLAIYLAHTIFAAATRVALVRIGAVGDPLVHLVCGSAAGLLIPLVLDRVCTRAGLRWIFKFPSARRGQAANSSFVAGALEGA